MTWMGNLVFMTMDFSDSVFAVSLALFYSDIELIRCSSLRRRCIICNHRTTSTPSHSLSSFLFGREYTCESPMFVSTEHIALCQVRAALSEPVYAVLHLDGV